MSDELAVIVRIIEAALLVSDEPLTLPQLSKLFPQATRPDKLQIKLSLEQLATECEDENRCVSLKELASGYVLQVKADYVPYLLRLTEQKPPRYTRATLETLALIAYRQPITRAEIEGIRGVAVSSHTIKQLQDRQWIKVIGHKDVPGRPALFATTKQFLDYFNVKDLTELPPLLTLTEAETAEADLAEQLTITGLEESIPTQVESVQALVEMAKAIEQQEQQTMQEDSELLANEDLESV